jgi:signal transduction histidine kinase
MLKIILMLCLLCCSGAAQALRLLPDTGLREPASLVGKLAVLRDADGLLGIDDVAAPGEAARFEALHDILSVGYTSDVYWLRFTLQREPVAPQNWLLEVRPPYLNQLTLFTPRADGGFDESRLGDLQAYRERPIQHRHFLFPLTLTDAQPQTLYLRVQTKSTMRVSLMIWQYPGVLAQAQSEATFYGAYFGILALALVSNLVFWLWMRERIYLVYSVYLIAMSVTALAAGGFASQWFLYDWPTVASRLVGVSVCLAYVAATSFFIQVLGFRQHFARLRVVINGVLIFYALSAVAASAGLYSVVAPWVMLLAISSNIGIVLAGSWLLWRGHREYLFYMLAFVASFVAVPLSVAVLMGWITLPVPTDFFIIFGSIIHIMLIGFTVVDRLRLSEEKVLAAVKETADLAAEREASRQQRQFVAMVSHEFRTPLAVIDATAQSVEIGSSQSTNLTYEFIAPRQEKIRRAVRRMVSLLDNFLTHERLDFKGPRGQPERVDLRDLVNEAANNWSHLLPVAGQLQLALGDEDVPVCVERAMVALALSNLIDNAIKYSPAGSLISLGVKRSGTNGWIEVADQGIGVATKEIALIFDKFYRSGNAQRVPGAGLGLYLVRTIAHSQGGEVSVESGTGQGSRFRLRLALVK